MTLRRGLILFCYSSSAYNNALPANAVRSIPSSFIISSSTTSFVGLTNLKTTPTRIQNFSLPSLPRKQKNEYPEPRIMSEQRNDDNDDDDDHRPIDERASNDDVVDDGVGAAAAAYTAVVACAASEDGRDNAGAAKGSVVRFFRYEKKKRANDSTSFVIDRMRPTNLI
jgi:hypothetical protein